MRTSHWPPLRACKVARRRKQRTSSELFGDKGSPRLVVFSAKVERRLPTETAPVLVWPAAVLERCSTPVADGQRPSHNLSAKERTTDCRMLPRVVLMPMLGTPPSGCSRALVLFSLNGIETSQKNSCTHQEMCHRSEEFSVALPHNIQRCSSVITRIYRLLSILHRGTCCNTTSYGPDQTTRVVRAA